MGGVGMSDGVDGICWVWRGGGGLFGGAWVDVESGRGEGHWQGQGQMC